MNLDLSRDLQAMFYRQRQRVRERLEHVEQRVSRARDKARQDTTEQWQSRGRVCGYVGRKVHTGD